MSSPVPQAPPRCLTAAEIAAVQAAAPGDVPAALALHLASCERCQKKALFGDTPRRTGRKALPDPPTIRRTLVLGLLALAVMAVFFWSLRQMAGQVR